MSDTNFSTRKRSKVACEPCRQRKRRCDGSRPCQTCSNLEYDCYYKPPERRRHQFQSEHGLAPVTSTSPSPYSKPLSRGATRDERPRHQLSHIEANSGAAFVREMALSLDPVNAPRMHLFAWNVFFGARQPDHAIAPQTSFTHLLSEFDMETLVMVYFEKVDPCYGFVDRRDVDRRVKERWHSPHPGNGQDAVLCGIAALGCVFSRCQSVDVEHSLAEGARLELERTLPDLPDFDTATAWVLYVTYLRITSTPHPAWMASCLMMHVVEAAGLHCEPGTKSIIQVSSSAANDELRRRLFGVAQHLNMWMSFDIGRSRVVLRNATTILPCERPDDYTVELLGLLSYTEMLDPGKTTDTNQLASALDSVLERTHSRPPSVLAQCNLVLCLYRRLRAADTVRLSSVIDKILGLLARAIRSVQEILNAGSPWHHMANIPFQAVCTLLAIDTPTSLAQLEDAMQTLENVATTYNTQAIQEALRTASMVILLHQRRKDSECADLGRVLRRHPVGISALRTPQGANFVDPQQQLPAGVGYHSWLDEAVADVPYLQNFDIDDFLCDEFR